MATEIDDDKILSEFQNGNIRNEAFNSLLKKYQQKVYWHVRRMVVDHDDADDLVQDIFIKVWKPCRVFGRTPGYIRGYTVSLPMSASPFLIKRNNGTM